MTTLSYPVRYMRVSQLRGTTWGFPPRRSFIRCTSMLWLCCVFGDQFCSCENISMNWLLCLLWISQTLLKDFHELVNFISFQFYFLLALREVYFMRQGPWNCTFFCSRNITEPGALPKALLYSYTICQCSTVLVLVSGKRFQALGSLLHNRTY